MDKSSNFRNFLTISSWPLFEEERSHKVIKGDVSEIKYLKP